MASSSLNRLWEPRFIPSASLAAAPEDIVVQILALLNVLDVLSVRRTCKRLYGITQARIVWLDLLRKSYRRRHLAPPDPQNTSQISTQLIERRAKRPFRFLHALADINSAKHLQTAWPVVSSSEEIAGGSNEDAGQSGIIAFEILPGGRWLFLVANRRTLGAIHAASGFHHRGPPRAIIFVWDLVLGVLRARHSLPRAAHVAAIQLDATTCGVTVLVGLEKTRLEDPYFTALRMFLPPISDDYDAIGRGQPPTMRFEQAGGIKVSRTPRACTVHGNILAFADRAGNILFWDFIENSSSSIQVQGWPATKGKLLLVSNELVAVFNPASSTFSIHVIPPLVTLSFPGTGPQGQTAIAPIPSAPLKRFRLPARNLILTFPKLRNRTSKPRSPPDSTTPTISASSSATSSSGLHSHESSTFTSSSGASGSGFQHQPSTLDIPHAVPPEVPNPSVPHASNSLVSAYFLLYHPEDPANLHLGIIPHINPNEEDDVIGDVDPDDGLGRASVEAVDGDLALVVSNEGPETAGPPNDPNLSIQQLGEPAEPAPVPAADNNHNNAEPTWLETLRCHDSTIAPTMPSMGNPASFQSPRDAFTFTTPRSKILYVGGTERILILRSTDEGVLEIFTTEAIWRRNWEAAHGPSQSLPAETPPSIPALSGSRRRPEIAPWAEGDYQTLSYRATGEIWAACVDDLSGKICMVTEDHNELYEIVVLDYGEGDGEQERWRTIKEDDQGLLIMRDPKGKGKAREGDARVDVKGKGKMTVVGDDSGTPGLEEDEEYGPGPSAIIGTSKGQRRAAMDASAANDAQLNDDEDDEDDGDYEFNDEEGDEDDEDEDDDNNQFEDADNHAVEDVDAIDIDDDDDDEQDEDEQDDDPDIKAGLRYSESEYLNQYAQNHHRSGQGASSLHGSGVEYASNQLPSTSTSSWPAHTDPRLLSRHVHDWQSITGNPSNTSSSHVDQGPSRLR